MFITYTVDNDGICVISVLWLQNVTDDVIDVHRLYVIIITNVVILWVIIIINWRQIARLVVTLSPQFSAVSPQLHHVRKPYNYSNRPWYYNNNNNNSSNTTNTPWIGTRAAINSVTPTTACLTRHRSVVSRTGRTEYQLLLMKASDWGRNVNFR